MSEISLNVPPWTDSLGVSEGGNKIGRWRPMSCAWRTFLKSKCSGVNAAASAIVSHV